jgi:transposase
MVLTGGNINDTTMMIEALERIRVPRSGRSGGSSGGGRPRTRPERVVADKGYPSKANRAYLARRGIKATIPDRDDQVRNRATKGSAGGRPPAFDAETYKRRNVVERGFNRLKSWRGIAMRCDKTARNYQAGITLAATLIWLNATT